MCSDVAPLNRQPPNWANHPRGEIADPKCYFRGDETGRGKGPTVPAPPAALPGYPPIFKAVSNDGQVQYFIVKGRWRTNQSAGPAHRRRTGATDG